MLLLQGGQEVEHLRLDRHVERRGGLVGDQELGIAGQGHRDHRALRHAAGELVRVVVGAVGGAGDADVVEQLDGARAGLAPGHALVHAQGLGDLVLDGEGGIQAGAGFLENHADLVAPDAVQFGRAASPRVRGRRSESSRRRCGPSRRGGPSPPSPSPISRTPTRRRDRAYCPACISNPTLLTTVSSPPRGGRELHREVGDLEQGRAGGVDRFGRGTRRPRSSRRAGGARWPDAPRPARARRGARPRPG